MLAFLNVRGCGEEDKNVEMGKMFMDRKADILAV